MHRREFIKTAGLGGLSFMFNNSASQPENKAFAETAKSSVKAKKGATIQDDKGWIIVCSTPNDLVNTLKANGYPVFQFQDIEEAVRKSPVGSGALLLSDGYPVNPIHIPASLVAEIERKRLRLYAEFTGSLPELKLGEMQESPWSRAVVASDFFGSELPKLRLMDLHDCRFLPVSLTADDDIITHLAYGRVAGFNTAVYGLPDPAYPLLFEIPERNLLMSTTKLSQFITSRYEPSEAWKTVWMRILNWVNPKVALGKFHFSATVRPSHPFDANLPDDHEETALRRGGKWFHTSRLLISPARDDQIQKIADVGIAPAPPIESVLGDGSHGIAEGYVSRIQLDGSQYQSIARRCDCTAESAMALAYSSKLFGKKEDNGVSKRLLDFLYFTSDARKREYADPKNGAYGLIAWGLNTEAWRIATYGDDEARVMLATLTASALLHEKRWLDPVMQCMLGDLRTTGRLGFREDRIDLGPLTSLGWRYFFDQSNTSFSPHYQSYLWACYLWGWHKTGFPLFQRRAENAIRMTMEAYPDRWEWTNGMQQERARMLLPLSWLVRVDDTPEHRSWLKRMATDLLALQDACGVIREEIGNLANGQCRPPQSNAAYGTAEAPLLQVNGDPVCDLLYTTNFAFLGLHEATTATGESFYSAAEERLAKFLCSIQVQSEKHPELNGGWYRAFDYHNWQYWASNSDAGWGVWSIESGWTQGWICAVLALRHMRTSLWNLLEWNQMGEGFNHWRNIMLPNDLLENS